MAETIPKIIYNSITITMENPLATNDPYKIETSKDEKFSLTGEKQTAFEYNDETKVIDIQFASESLKDSLYSFYSNWASEGKEFSFYPDKDSASFDTVTMDEKAFTITRQKTGMSSFKVKFKIRKVI